MFGGRAYPVVLSAAEDGLTFSNTMEWNTDRLAALKRLDHRLVARIALPEPPSNDSPVAAEEIEGILEKQRGRTAAQEAAIRHEINLDGMMDRFPALTRKDRRRLLNTFAGTVEPVVVHFKKTFDRVRPRALDGRVRPSIEPPGHPAYPSGHATQAYYVALYLGKKHPGRADAFLRTADAVARNREWAGVHYPSDTTAGRHLAEQLFLLKG
jgi:acid phosphatase (class A)